MLNFNLPYFMKHISKFLIIIFIFGIVSCRDTKKEEEVETITEETEMVTPDTESVTAEVDKASETLDKEVKELDEAIKELDSI